MPGVNAAVGRLTDILITYDQVDQLFGRYNYLYDRISAVKKDYEKQIKRISPANLLKYYIVCVFISCLLCVIYAIGGLISPIAYIILIFIVPALFVGTVAIVYRIRLIPKCRKLYEDYRKDADVEYRYVKDRLVVQHKNIELLTDGMEAECRDALAVYIMRQAAIEDKCCNIYEAQSYYIDRLHLLQEKNNDEDGTLAKIKESQNATLKMMESLRSIQIKSAEIQI